MDFHCKENILSLRKVGAGLLYLENIAAIFSEYTIFGAGAGGTPGRDPGGTWPLRAQYQALSY